MFGGSAPRKKPEKLVPPTIQLDSCLAIEDVDWVPPSMPENVGDDALHRSGNLALDLPERVRVGDAHGPAESFF